MNEELAWSRELSPTQQLLSARCGNSSAEDRETYHHTHIVSLDSSRHTHTHTHTHTHLDKGLLHLPRSLRPGLASER